MLMTVVTMMLTQNWIFNESFLQQLSDSASRPSDGRGWKGGGGSGKLDDRDDDGDGDDDDIFPPKG